MAGELSFVSFSGTVRPTAYGLYDNIAEFQADADKTVYFVMRALGSPVLDTELDLRQIWTAFEDSTSLYSKLVNMNHGKNILLDLLGKTTGTLSGSENAFVLGNTVNLARKLTIQYSHEFGTNSPYPTYSSSVDLVEGVQKYNLLDTIAPQLASLTSSGASVDVQIRNIHHYEPTAAYRFFDTTSVVNFMANNLNFASYSPETIFYLLPIWEDILRGTQLSLNQRVRRSNYSFDLKGYVLTVFPVPSSPRPNKLFFEWTLAPGTTADALSSSIGGISLHQGVGVVSNISNAAFGHIGYNNINSIGKKWIWDMTLAKCKIELGNVRNKYSEIPIPDGSITLNGSELISQGQQEAANLEQELKELMEAMSYKNLMAERNELEEFAVAAWKRVPMRIYISR